MGAIFSYAISSSLLLCLGYLAYKWIMAGERQHSCNRATLYIIYVLALTLPAFAGGWKNMLHTSQHSQNTAIEIGELTGGVIMQETPVETYTSIVPLILTSIYAAGVVLTLIFSLIGAFQLIAIIRKGDKIRNGRYILVISERNDIAPFSWLNYYVMSRNDYETAGEIISIHERRHLRLYHWIDLFFVQIVNIFQWFNPAAWLMGEEFKTVHEYQADEAVMASGTNLRQYQTLLIKKAVGTRFQVLANSLNHSKLKKRVTMMYKSKSSKSRRFGALLLVPAMGIGCAVIEIPAVAAALDTTSAISLIEDNNGKVNDFSANNTTGSIETIDNSLQNSSIAEQNPILNENMQKDETVINTMNDEDSASESSIEATNDAVGESIQQAEQASAFSNATPAESLSAVSDEKDKKDEVYVSVETLPEFPGGIAELMKWLSMNIRYPEKAHKEDIQGRVVVKFVIGKDGKVGDATVIKGVDPELDKEALRVIKLMPAWKPAENNGKTVACYYNMPITFKLQDDAPQKTETETPQTK